MKNQQQKPTAFVLDNDAHRSNRAARIESLKNLGFTVVPGRDFDLSLGRCLRKDFDLIVVHEAQSLAKAMEVCDKILAAKPRQPLLLLSPTKLDKRYSCSDDVDSVAERVQKMVGLMKQVERAAA